MNYDLLVALFGWAVSLSGLPDTHSLPTVILEGHSFFVEKACANHECRVLGWYPGSGNVIYLDSHLNPVESTRDASIVVHEFVHYLQAHSTDDRPYATDCERWVAWERQAYNVQREYIVAYGDYIPVGFSMMDVRCE